MNISQFKIYLFQFTERIFGKRLVRNLYSNRCLAIFRKNGLIFIHIPKAGGTSVAQALFGKRAGHDYAENILNQMGNKEYEKLYSFSMTRNPFERLVSAYHYAVQGGGSQGGVRKRSIYKAAVFSSFSTFVKDWLIFQDAETIDIIFRPQYLFVFDKNDKLLVNWIGKIEAKNEIENIILEKFGKKVEIKRRNTSRRNNYQHYYTDELQQLVAAFYSKDFELFGYSTKISSTPEPL